MQANTQATQPQASYCYVVKPGYCYVKNAEQAQRPSVSLKLADLATTLV